jgi:hypothetical protein
VSRVGVDLADRGAGHQASLFSIRPPEVQRQHSLEDSSTRHSSTPRCIGAARVRLRFASEAAVFRSFRIDVGACAIAFAFEVELNSRPNRSRD